MKNKTIIILTILLLVGTLVTGNLLSSRDSILTKEESSILKSEGITEFYSSDIKCSGEICSFWIKKEGVVNQQRFILSYNRLCEQVKETDKESGEEFLVEICEKIPKTSKELIDERDRIVDEVIKETAERLSKQEPTKTTIGTDMEVRIK